MDPCTSCGRTSFTSQSGRTLHVKACSGTTVREVVDLPPCPTCKKSDFTSKSGRTLHTKTCDGRPEPSMKLPEEDGVFSLDVYTFLKPIDPVKYFVTSGEAIAKAQKLEKDLWEAAGMARKMVKALEEARFDAKYLETSWNNGVLEMRRKNPRKKSLASPEAENDIEDIAE
jgi:hypothetical protein